MTKNIVDYDRLRDATAYLSCPCCAEGKMLVKDSDIALVNTGTQEETQFQCLQCYKFLCSIEDISHHNRCSTKDYPPTKQQGDDFPVTYFCQICGNLFNDEKTYSNHACVGKLSRKRKLKKGSTDCPVCQFSFSSYLSCRRHFTRNHSIVRFVCVICNKQFVKKYLLRAHFREHTGDCPYPCNICGRRFRSSALLWSHRKYSHDTEGYQCDICLKFYPTKQDLANHIRIKHTKVRSLSCDDCGKTFLSTSVLYQHKATHSSIRKYACDLCPMRFKRQTTLRNHQLIHANLRPHSCPFCARQFRQLGEMKRHCTLVHSDLEKADSP